MKLLIILFSLPIVFAIKNEYRGFKKCNYEGWTCDVKKINNTTIKSYTYTCGTVNLDSRIWVWTARLPSDATVFTVQNCRHLEVHFDCTSGLRNSKILEFSVRNVEFLDILPTTVRGLYLHDNLPLYHVPQNMFFENITVIKLQPGLFKRTSAACRYFNHSNQVIEIIRSGFLEIGKDELVSHEAKLVMDQVDIKAMESGAISIKDGAVITRSDLPDLLPNAIYLQGDKVTIKHTVFKNIKNQGITVRSNVFEFHNNKIEGLNTNALDVVSREVHIFKNLMKQVESGAFELITAGNLAIKNSMSIKAGVYKYNFTRNTLENMYPGALHNNWEGYKDICANITISHNIFNCTCDNIGWINSIGLLGQKIQKFKSFYVDFSTRDNICMHHSHCELSKILSKIKNNCEKDVNISSYCGVPDETDEPTTMETDEDEEEYNYIPLELKPDEEDNFNIEDFDDFGLAITRITSTSVPVIHAEHHTMQEKNQSPPLWCFLLIVFVCMIIATIGVFFWYKKKRQRVEIIKTIYKNERNSDTDHLIIVNEQNIELNDKE